MNNQLIDISSKILRNKLAKLAIDLQSSSNEHGINSDLKTFESVIGKSIEVLNKFYKRLDTSSFAPTKIMELTIPDAATYNKTFSDIQDDLEVIFQEFENLEQIVVGEFNYMVSKLNFLNRIMKSIYSNLGDFILFSELPTKDANFFSDSFSNLNRIEANSPLLNNEQCEISQSEGIVTLPINRQEQKIVTVTDIPVINSNSNGRIGNQEQAGVSLQGNIKDILDNNADTWFEYEKVSLEDDGIPLILDFTINLNSPKIINSIQINPNNFGTKTQIEIVTINTSIDGKDFVSIKDDVPIPGFVTVDEDNIFILAPSTSKFAGQGIYTFTPRKAKYIHIVLKQTTPYLIVTSGGIQKFRYAIGIRDINIFALPYNKIGEVISINYILNDEVRKVALLSSQNPDAATVSNLATIKHFVSPDNGITWHEIRPKISAGIADSVQEIPEILDFNGISNDTILTDSPIYSLRYKAILERFPEAFVEEAANLVQTIAKGTELHTPPNTTPFDIVLQKSPIEKTIQLIDPQFGSRGKEEIKYNIAIGRNVPLNILLPFKPLKRDLVKTWSVNKYILEDCDPEKIYVDGNLWTRGLSSSAGSTDKLYKLNYEEGRLVFGDGINGQVIATGSRISMTLAEERLFPTQDDQHIAKLDYITSNDKKQMEVYCIEPPKSHTLVLKKGVKRHQLFPNILTNVTPYKIKFSDDIVFKTEITPFIDGNTELTDTGHYSIDYTNGVLYSYSATNTITDTTVIYFYTPRTRLTENDWSFASENLNIIDSISIKDSIFKSYLSDWETIPTGVRYFNLGNLAIVKGTIQLSHTVSPATAFETEVPFIDGRSELFTTIVAKESFAAITGISGTETKELSLQMKITADTSFAVTFSNQNVFQNEKSALIDINNVGDYFVDRTGTTSAVHVRVDSNIDFPGTITYYYDDPQADPTGKYSINYNTGEAFLYNVTPAGSVVRYNYTDYRTRYNIARLVSPDDWSFDAANKKITIQDREILKNIQIPQDIGQGTNSKYYQVVFDYVESTRANINELEPYFTPILKDYALKIITRSNLI